MRAVVLVRRPPCSPSGGPSPGATTRTNYSLLTRDGRPPFLIVMGASQSTEGRCAARESRNARDLAGHAGFRRGGGLAGRRPAALRSKEPVSREKLSPPRWPYEFYLVKAPLTSGGEAQQGLRNSTERLPMARARPSG
jgi:hypothetical protein